jgi:hypothetical protein
VDTTRIAPAGDPFTAKAPKREDLLKLEERYRHELMDEEERAELRDQLRYLRLRGRLEG